MPSRRDWLCGSCCILADALLKPLIAAPARHARQSGPSGPYADSVTSLQAPHPYPLMSRPPGASRWPSTPEAEVIRLRCQPSNSSGDDGALASAYLRPLLTGRYPGIDDAFVGGDESDGSIIEFASHIAQDIVLRDASTWRPFLARDGRCVVSMSPTRGGFTARFDPAVPILLLGPIDPAAPRQYAVSDADFEPSAVTYHGKAKLYPGLHLALSILR